MFKKITVVFFSFLVFFITPVFAESDSVFAQNEASNLYFPQFPQNQILEVQETTPPLKFLPDHPLYFLITLKEQVQRLTKPNVLEKAKFDIVLAAKRAKEAYALSQKGNLKSTSQSLLRYSQKIEHIKNDLEKVKKQKKDLTEIIELLVSHLEKHQVFFTQIYHEVNEYKRKELLVGLEKSREGLKTGINIVVREKPNYKERLEKLIKPS